jgi:hypothetical protein
LVVAAGDFYVTRHLVSTFVLLLCQTSSGGDTQTYQLLVMCVPSTRVTQVCQVTTQFSALRRAMSAGLSIVGTATDRAGPEKRARRAIVAFILVSCNVERRKGE